MSSITYNSRMEIEEMKRKAAENGPKGNNYSPSYSCQQYNGIEPLNVYSVSNTGIEPLSVLFKV